jgi:hypothetical protein
MAVIDAGIVDALSSASAGASAFDVFSSQWTQKFAEHVTAAKRSVS